MTLFPHSPHASPRRHGVGLWASALAFATVLAFSTLPTPLYAIYQARDGFSTFLITVVFAAYALGVIVALFFAGHLSDVVGRRRALLPAILLSLGSAAVFLVWRDLPGLLIARVMSGLAVGVVTSTATAFIAELHAGHRPAASPRRAQMVSTTANLGGLGVGPLIGGLLAEYVRSPLTVPFLLFLGLLALAAIAVALTPETVTRPRPRPPYHPQRIAVPDRDRGRFLAAATAAFVCFAALGLFTSLAPAFLAGTLHRTSYLLAGVTAFIAFAGAVVTQLLTADWPLTRMLGIGMATMTIGIAAVIAGAWLPSLAVFLLGGAVTGVGVGLLFKGGVVTASGLAAPGQRAEVLAGFFLAGYVGISIPVLGLGVLDQLVTPKIGLLAFGALLVAGIAVAAPKLLGVGPRVRRPALDAPVSPVGR